MKYVHVTRMQVGTFSRWYLPACLLDQIPICDLIHSELDPAILPPLVSNQSCSQSAGHYDLVVRLLIRVAESELRLWVFGESWYMRCHTWSCIS